MQQAYIMAGIEEEGQQKDEFWFQEQTDQLRALLDAERKKREERGEGFNEAEFVREQLVEQERAAEVTGDNLKRLGIHGFVNYLDALAYDRYTSVDVQNRALRNLATHGYRREFRVLGTAGPTRFGVIARVLGLPYTSEHPTIRTSPAALAELRELGVKDGVDYNVPLTMLAKARRANNQERGQSPNFPPGANRQ